MSRACQASTPPTELSPLPRCNGVINGTSWGKRTATGSWGRLAEAPDPAAVLVPGTGSYGVFLGLVSGVSASGDTEEEKTGRQENMETA